MKIKNILRTVALLAITLAMPSCSDFLDHQPDERTEIKTVDEVQKLLITSYPSGNYSWLCELSGDNLQDNQSPHSPSIPGLAKDNAYYNYASFDRFEDELFRFELAKSATVTSRDTPGFLWEQYYTSVACANVALQTLDKIKAENNGVETSKAKAMRAEALLIRAYDHLCLVSIFGQAWKNEEISKNEIGVPFVTEIETTAQKEYTRDNVATVFDKIEKDIEEALPNVSETYMTTAPKYHFNYNAAHALAARFYLYKRDWRRVIEEANCVLGTDSISADRMMLDYEPFDDCAMTSDFANVWQSPDQNNNLMLNSTHSYLMREALGNRYSVAGKKCQDVMLVRNSTLMWGGVIIPIQSMVANSVLGSFTKDYGFYSAKILEKFEYVNKIAGTGMPHIIHRAFTAAELLLERAEAKIMLGDYYGATEDLCIYWNSAYGHFSQKNKELYEKDFYMFDERTLLMSYTNPNLPNCYADWNFTQKISPDYVIPAEAVPYMNCLNEFRRFETAFEGLRFFDLKRWGMPFEHVIGINSEVIRIEANDPRLAVEVPWEVLSAGMHSSRPEPDNYVAAPELPKYGAFLKPSND